MGSPESGLSIKSGMKCTVGIELLDVELLEVVVGIVNLFSVDNAAEAEVEIGTICTFEARALYFL